MLRKIAQSAPTTVHFSKKDDFYFYNVSILMRTTSQKFKFGEELEIKTTDGRRIKNLFTFKENVVIEQQFGDKEMTIRREFFDDHLISVANIGDLTATTWYKLIN